MGQSRCEVKAVGLAGREIELRTFGDGQ